MTFLLVDIALTGAVLGFTCAVLARPLSDVLIELCAGERRARFWVVTTQTALAAGVLLAGALSLAAVPGGRSVSGLAWPLRSACAAAVFGLGAVTVVVLAFERATGRDA
jgi:hypothetical protein